MDGAGVEGPGVEGSGAGGLAAGRVGSPPWAAASGVARTEDPAGPGTRGAAASAGRAAGAGCWAGDR